jgi:hypothetical protein
VKTIFQKIFSKKPAPLSGVPAVRRQKTYSAQSGYVYQYFYDGHRGDEQETEYVFTVSGDRKEWHPASIRLASEALRSWEQKHGRTLSSTEQYAIAKMALFQAFDERTSPAQMKEDIRIRPADVEAIMEALGL